MHVCTVTQTAQAQIQATGEAVWCRFFDRSYGYICDGDVSPNGEGGVIELSGSRVFFAGGTVHGVVLRVAMDRPWRRRRVPEEPAPPPPQPVLAKND
jgi:hypothetical protein